MAEGNRTAAAAPLRAALLAIVLTVLAGFLGMHVVGASNGVHSPAEHSATAAAGDPTSGTAASHHLRPDHRTAPPPSCACEGACGEEHTAHASCTPAPAGPSPVAPAAATTALGTRARTALADSRAPAYSYLPATPTPTELSISRT